MTLRLEPSDEQALDELAEALNTSRQKALIYALHETVERRARREAVSRFAAEESAHYAHLLERLGQ